MVDAHSPAQVPNALAEIAAAPDEVAQKSAAASAFAAAHFSVDAMADAFAAVVESAAAQRLAPKSLDR